MVPTTEFGTEAQRQKFPPKLVSGAWIGCFGLTEPNHVVPLVANPIRMSESPVSYRTAPPTLGQHTQEVLASWLEMTPSDVDTLRQHGVL